MRNNIWRNFYASISAKIVLIHVHLHTHERGKADRGTTIQGRLDRGRQCALKEIFSKFHAQSRVRYTHVRIRRVTEK